MDKNIKGGNNNNNNNRAIDGILVDLKPNIIANNNNNNNMSCINMNCYDCNKCYIKEYEQKINKTYNITIDNSKNNEYYINKPLIDLITIPKKYDIDNINFNNNKNKNKNL